MIFLLFLIGIIFIIIALYFLIIILYQDLSLPDLNLNNFKSDKPITNALVIFPHPDDETMATGGLINKLAKNKDFITTVIAITKGEAGDELLKLSPNELGKIREIEFSNAVKQLDIDRFEIWDLGDGKVTKNYEKAKDKIRKFISENNIDLVVTYERTGMYGHKDHVALSKIIHELHELNNFKLLYATLPRKIERKLNIKAYMKNIELEAAGFNEQPEYKLQIFNNLFAKYRAARQHKSQKLSHNYPLWFTMLVMPFEYYTTRYERSENRK